MVFMVSGYMITRGFLDRYYGLLLHTNLDLPIMAIFTTHIGINIRYLLIRKGIKDSTSSRLLVLVISAVLIILIVYLDLFFKLQ